MAQNGTEFSKLFTLTRLSELSSEDQQLVELCRNASHMAYAPYSGFKVGAAILLDHNKAGNGINGDHVGGLDHECMVDHGVMVSGCNVENASYGLTICAERTAITKAVSQGLLSSDTEVRAVCVFAEMAEKDAFVWPCGACRQVLSEFNPAMEIYSIRTDDIVAKTNLAKLLPLAFSPKSVNLEFYNN